MIRAIAQEGSLNRAAASLGMAQPSLSHQLRRIERLLGGQLFDRDQQGTRPTELGRLVLARAKAIVLAFDEIERDFRRQQPHAADFVRIGWNDSALTAQLLDCVQVVLPGVAVRTRADVSRLRLLTQLTNRCVDAALVMICGSRPLSVPPGVRTTVIVEEPAFLALPAAHPLAARAEIALAELADQDWIVSSCGDGCRVVFRELCQAHGFSPRIAHDVDTDSAREALVLGGYGVGLMQPTRPQRPGLAIRPLSGTPMLVRHVLAWREESTLAFCADEIAVAATEAYWDLARRTPHYQRWLDNGTTAPSGTSRQLALHGRVNSPCLGIEESAVSRATASAT
ncbi:DNA-binding transcriptional LysR family regulator [Kutzneria viridogrisea]|uniref:DNA-binding transcriptional LysR family regulator n=1 Tax=Kutzneria viridogrisea TaxID=47990 RepID=A0ABR6B865_9PSEU|nr:LysR family transcriptional regulator [Kutzneria albida]MBA8923052.1 DNA-binding transcriptional LysR family regulator [Kutzneria viridogrisea]